MNARGFLFSTIILAVAFLAGAPAIAQDAAPSDESSDRVIVRGNNVTIEIDEEGRVLVDGRQVSDDNSPVVLHVEPSDGEIEIEAVDPRDRRIIVRGTPRASDHVRHGDHVRFRGDFDWPRVASFVDGFEFETPALPDMAPLMERFHLEIGDPMRASLREHREVAEQEREAREMAGKVRAADGDARAQYEAELREKLHEIFDKKVESSEEAIADLEDRVEDERERLSQRRDARQEIIERRLRTLIGEDDLMEW